MTNLHWSAKAQGLQSLGFGVVRAAWVRCTDDVGAWEHWYHVMGSTYGAWLPGDRRGFSTRHHREHVERSSELMAEDDPKRWREDWSRELMGRKGVELSVEARRVACATILEALRYHGCLVKAIGVGGMHYHVVARFENDDVRRIVGIAKKRSAWRLSEMGLVVRGGVWAVRCGVKSIVDGDHLDNARRYVLGHVSQGAVVWPSEPCLWDCRFKLTSVRESPGIAIPGL